MKKKINFVDLLISLTCIVSSLMLAYIVFYPHIKKRPTLREAYEMCLEDTKDFNNSDECAYSEVLYYYYPEIGRDRAEHWVYSPSEGNFIYDGPVID